MSYIYIYICHILLKKIILENISRDKQYSLKDRAAVTDLFFKLFIYK